MFNYFERQKHKQRRAQKTRIMIITFISTVVSAGAAFLFGQKKVRKEVFSRSQKFGGRIKTEFGKLKKKLKREISKNSATATKETKAVIKKIKRVKVKPIVEKIKASSKK